MGKYTPGPWRCELFYENGDKSSEVVPKNYRKSELHEPICIIPHDDVSEDSAPEMLANVRLIVAAPELLEALQTLVTGPRSDRGDVILDDDDMAGARAAIAKATGEQP